MMTSIINIPEYWLDLSDVNCERVWQQSQAFSTAPSRWSAYLNQLCLQTVLPWIQAEYVAHATSWLNSIALASVLEVVNGTAIEFSISETNPASPARRLILIPTEAIDTEELRVPQEWVDLASWMGDYYLAVQINLDGGWIRPWGYATHAQLKMTGTYDAQDRTYSLNQDQLITDPGLLWLSQEFMHQEPTQVTIEPLSLLSTTQINHLVQRLANPEILNPRLEIPFSLWGGLMEQSQARQKLYRHRQGIERINLQNWFSNTIQAGWQSWSELQATANPSYQFRGDLRSSNTQLLRVKSLDLGTTQVTLVLDLEQESDDQIGVRAQLYPISSESYLPAGVQLSLLSSADEILKKVVVDQPDIMMLQMQRFTCPVGLDFSLRVTLGEIETIEEFTA